MNAIFNFLKRPAILISAIIIICVIGGYFYFKESPASLGTIVATRGEIMQEVSVTGKTKAAKNIDLAFEQGGKVKRVDAIIGEKVLAGQNLVELDSSELYAQLSEKEADIETQQAKLNELKKGTRPEEITVYETKLANAESSLDDAKRNLTAKIQDAYTKSDDSVRNKVDQFFSNPRSSNPQINISGFYNEADVEWQRLLIESLLTGWQNSLIGLDVSGNLDARLQEAKLNLQKVRDFLDLVSLGVNALTANANLSQTTIDTYKSNISTTRTNINTAITNLQSAEETLRSAESGVLLAEKNLALQKAGSTAEQIAAQEASVKKAEASADIIRVKISKNILHSPINGIVTKQNAKAGEIVSANVNIVSVISSGGFELEANVPEADIPKIKVGDSAKVTLDAFGNDKIFEAKVIKIDPGETIIEGVAAYKTTFSFLKESEGVKSGMTANIDILTAKKEGVIVIPQRAVAVKNGEKFARILSGDGTVKEIKVETGLRGSDGNVEIISGINEGDKVVYGAY